MFGLIEIMWDVSVDIAWYGDVVLFSKQSTLTFITKTVLEVVVVVLYLIELIVSYTTERLKNKINSKRQLILMIKINQSKI